MIGQILYLEAEAAGTRATGIGCFFDDPVHELIGLPDDAFQSLYHFMVGGPREDARLATRANEGTGRVDLVLTLGELVIACEISATTRAEHEFERSVKKCVQAGFERIVIICNAPKRRAKIQEMVVAGCTSEEQLRIACISVDEFLGRLSGLGAAHQSKQAASTAGSEPKQATQGLDVSEAERQKATKKIWEDINRRKKRTVVKVSELSSEECTGVSAITRAHWISSSLNGFKAVSETAVTAMVSARALKTSME